MIKFSSNKIHQRDDTYGVVNIGDAGDILAVNTLRSIISGTDEISRLPLFVLGDQGSTDGRAATFVSHLGDAIERPLLGLGARGMDIFSRETAFAGRGREQLGASDAVESTITGAD